MAFSLLHWKWTVTSIGVELTWQGRRGGGDQGREHHRRSSHIARNIRNQHEHPQTNRTPETWKKTKRLSSLSHEDRSGYCRDSSQKLILNKENNKNALNCTTYTRNIKWTATIKTLKLIFILQYIYLSYAVFITSNSRSDQLPFYNNVQNVYCMIITIQGNI